MEGEINNFIMVWMIILTSILYCHTIAKIIPQGTTRLLSLIPIVCLFFYLPLNLTTIHLSASTSFFISWLGNYKVILFAFGKGPLSSNPPLHLSRFIPIACLPVKTLHDSSQIHQTNQNPSLKTTKKQNPCEEMTQKGKKPPHWIIGAKVLIFGIILMFHEYVEYKIHPKLKLACYCYCIYCLLELVLWVATSVVRALLGVELEPPFNEPYLATSLQDFWGRRWNIIVTNILHPAVYKPVQLFCDHTMSIPRKWASFFAVMATFFMSGVIHEITNYYMGRVMPTGEITAFFIINGLCLCIEIAVKKSFCNGKLRLPAVVSIPVTLGFVMCTSFWLFFPSLLRFDADVRICKEMVAFLQFVTHGRLVSPNDVSCPYF